MGVQIVGLKKGGFSKNRQGAKKGVGKEEQKSYLGTPSEDNTELIVVGHDRGHIRVESSLWPSEANFAREPAESRTRDLDRVRSVCQTGQAILASRCFSG